MLFRAFAGLILLVCCAAGAVAGPRIERVRSPGGIEAWLVREPSIPIVALEAVWRDAGVKETRPGQEGVSDLLAAMLTQGAGELDSQAFAERLQDKGISISFGADRDHFSLSFRTLTENQAEAFDLLGDTLARPRFDEEPFLRVKRSLATRLSRDQEQPSTIASRALFAAAFPDHAYGRPPHGTAETVAALTREDMRSYLERELARDRLVIGVVGDIDAATLGPLLDKVFAGLPESAGRPRPIALTVPEPRSRPIVIERDMPQSVVQFMGPGVLRSDPDYYAAYVMNYMLGGGGFNSRLTHEVREKRGLAYSVYSYLMPLREAGVWAGGVATRNEQVGESLQIIRAELERMRDAGPTAQELADAKTFLNGSFPLQLSSNAAIAGTLVAMQIADLGIGYIDERPQLINAVTAEAVQRVARRMLDPANMLVVVVGRPVGLGG